MEDRKILKAKISKTRQVNTYAHMLHASHVMLYKGEKDSSGSFYQYMASLVFTAFALEAYLNHLGKKLFLSWWEDFKRLPLKIKLILIADRLKLEKNDGIHPFNTVNKLFDFRNKLAHGITEPLGTKGQFTGTESGLRKHLSELLETKWEKYCNLQNAKQAILDVEAIIKQLHDKAGVMGIDDDILFSLGSSFSGAELMHEESQ